MITIKKKSSASLGAVLGAAAAPVILLIAFSQPAAALPSYARQTGYSCNMCHTTPPELTQEGRDFKLNGYTLKQSASVTGPKSKRSGGLDLLTSLPLSAWFEASYTSTNASQPGTQNGSVEFPQDISLFLSGAWSTHVGSFMQVTYDTTEDHFGMDNTDIRYANQTMFLGKNLHYGITLNNNPTVEDLWNSTPAWGFPYIANDSAPGPMAATIINNTLGQDVAGIGVYGLWQNHYYLATTLYRSEHIGSPQPLDGTDATYNIQGVAPYWRAAWQHPSRKHYLEVGTYGMHMSSTPGGVVGLRDTYTDVAVDFQYDWTVTNFNFDQVAAGKLNDVLSFRATYIHESSSLNGTFAAGGASQIDHHLNTVQGNAEYHFGDRLSFAVGGFSISGTPDPMLFAQDPIDGSANGDPKSNGYLLNVSYWPTMNIDLAVQYRGYLQFNGAGTNYDGAGRNASDNNSVYVLSRFVF